MTDRPAIGSVSTSIWITDTVSATVDSCPTLSFCTMNESYAVERIRGTLITVKPSRSSRSGTTVNTYAVTAIRTHGFSTVTSSGDWFIGLSELSVGLIRANMSGTPVRSLMM